MTHLWPDSPPLVGANERLLVRLAAEAQAIALADAEAEALRGDFSDKLVRRWINLCESPRTSRRMLRLIKVALANRRNGRRVYAIINKLVVTPLARSAGVPTSALKIELVASQLAGMAAVRYILKIEPLASMDREELARHFAPAIRATLKG